MRHPTLVTMTCMTGITGLLAPTLALAAPPTLELLPSVVSDQPGYVLARAISGDGQIIAGSQTPTMWERPFIWRRVDGQWRRFSLPGEGGLGWGRPISLSSDGDTIAGMTNQYLPGAVAFGTPAVWTHVLSGTPTLVSPLDDGTPPNIRRGVFAGLSADGSFAAGFAQILSPTTSPGELWSYADGVATRLTPSPTTLNYQTALLCGNPVSADGSILVGSVFDSTHRIAVRWTAATGFVPLPTPTTGDKRNSRAETISRDGAVIGGHLHADTVGYNTDARPALWTNAGRIDLPMVPVIGSDARVLCLSPDGSVAGGVQYNGILGLDFGPLANATAIFWVNGQVNRLSTYLTARGVDLQGLTPNWITGIADDGRTLVGFGTFAGSTYASFIVTLATSCPADLNDDGQADFTDYLLFLNLYEALDPRVDFTADGTVDFADYLEFLNLYDAGC